MSKFVRVGDKVMWRGCFGSDQPQVAVVEHMEVTQHPRSKYGEPVQCAPMDAVRANRVIFTLTNGHWCYAEQIGEVLEDYRDGEGGHLDGCAG